MVGVGKDGVGDYVTYRVFPLPDSLTGNTNKNRTGALTWEELRVRRSEVAQELDDLKAQNAELASRRLGPAASAEEMSAWTTQISYSEFEVKHKTRVLRNIEVEMQLRPVLAFGCICFVLIGCPVGIWASRSDYLSIFVICFLPTLFAYYPLLLAQGRPDRRRNRCMGLQRLFGGNRDRVNCPIAATVALSCEVSQE